jgi:hypothetical protein
MSNVDRKNQEGLSRLKEAKEYAEWSRNDRESKVPPLTIEQREQLRNYLSIVEEHGLKHAFAAMHRGEEHKGLPIMGLGKSVSLPRSSGN